MSLSNNYRTLSNLPDSGSDTDNVEERGPLPIVNATRETS